MKSQCLINTIHTTQVLFFVSQRFSLKVLSKYHSSEKLRNSYPVQLSIPCDGTLVGVVTFPILDANFLKGTTIGWSACLSAVQTLVGSLSWSKTIPSPRKGH